MPLWQFQLTLPNFLLVQVPFFCRQTAPKMAVSSLSRVATVSKSDLEPTKVKILEKVVDVCMVLCGIVTLSF